MMENESDMEMLDKVGQKFLNEDNEIVPVQDAFDSVEEWAEWWDDPHNRMVKDESVNGYDVRTAFFGINYNHHNLFTGEGEPHYFGTMVFEDGKSVDWFEERFYPSYDEAVEGHMKAVKDVEEFIKREQDA